MAKLRAFFFSQKGIEVVNVLFFLAAVYRGQGIAFAACLLWIVYLLYCRKITASKAVRTVYAVLIGFAAVMLAVNVWAILRVS